MALMCIEGTMEKKFQLTVNLKHVFFLFKFFLDGRLCIQQNIKMIFPNFFHALMSHEIVWCMLL